MRSPRRRSRRTSEQIEHLTRLFAADAYQRAWTAYRAESPAWQKRDPGLRQLEPLLREVAEAGPVALYCVDQNFFPLSLWLKDRMKASLDELNRVAEHLVSTEGDLDQRVSLAAEVRRPDFVSRVAAPAGAFLADGIIQTLGIEAYRAALAQGPRAFFEAYDKASQQKGRQLIPLARPSAIGCRRRPRLRSAPRRDERMDSYLALEKMLLILCADLAIIIGASRVFGWLFGKVGQPPVVGEILAGVILGPSLLGRLYPARSRRC